MLSTNEAWALAIGLLVGASLMFYVQHLRYKAFMRMLWDLSSLCTVCAMKNPSSSTIKFWLSSYQQKFFRLHAPNTTIGTWSTQYSDRYAILRAVVEAVGSWQIELEREETLQLARDAYRDMKAAMDFVTLRECFDVLQDFLNTPFHSMGVTKLKTLGMISLSEELGHDHDDLDLFFEECARTIVDLDTKDRSEGGTTSVSA